MRKEERRKKKHNGMNAVPDSHRLSFRFVWSTANNMDGAQTSKKKTKRHEEERETEQQLQFPIDAVHQRLRDAHKSEQVVPDAAVYCSAILQFLARFHNYPILCVQYKFHVYPSLCPVSVCMYT